MPTGDQSVSGRSTHEYTQNKNSHTAVAIPNTLTSHGRPPGTVAQYAANFSGAFSKEASGSYSAAVIS